MNTYSSLQIWVSLFHVVYVFAIKIARNRELNLTESSFPPSQSSLVYPLNLTSSSPGISANRPVIFCDGDQYGTDLLLADCRDAITGIKRSRQELRFGERSADQATWDVGLPSRQIGSEDLAE